MRLNADGNAQNIYMPHFLFDEGQTRRMLQQNSLRRQTIPRVSPGKQDRAQVHQPRTHLNIDAAEPQNQISINRRIKGK